MKFYSHFPREVGRYRNSTVNSVDGLVSYINRWNGRRDIYTSVYGFTDLHNTNKYERYNSAIIDKIYWDVDPYYYDYESKDKIFIGDIEKRTLNLSDKLMDDEVAHTIVASGGGMNVYAETTDFPLATERKKDTIYAIQEHYNDDFIRADKLHGDVARISRIPGTRNMKFRPRDGKKYAIFITRKDLETGKWKYKSERNINKISHVKGKNKIDLHYWESKSPKRYTNDNLGIYEEGIDKTDIKLDSDWFCVNEAMSRCGNGANHTNRDRFIVLSYMFNTGYSSPQARGIIDNQFSIRNIDKVGSEGQLKHIYERGISFPNKQTLKFEKRCNECNLCEE